MKPFLGMCLLLALATSAGADEQTEKIFSRARALNPGLQDFSAELDIQMQADMGPIHYKPKLQGKYYFKQADKHKIELNGGPKEIRKYPAIFGFQFPQMERFDSTMVEESVYKGRPVFHCRLVPKWTGDNIKQVDYLIDKERYTVAQASTGYRNEGNLTLDFEYTKVGNFTVFESLKANADFPSMSASANGEAKYSHYSFNQNLPNSLFNKDKRVSSR
ncbi:MAG: hypothetical protein J0I12_02440 [Candidatus Eremiobacteraeota bacterium]|nr:hypothetical protein [Candidatus Eremiobacteraeota bacterium]